MGASSSPSRRPRLGATHGRAPEGEVDGDHVDGHAGRAGLHEAARLLAVDDEGVGGPPPARLVRRGSGPALERHGVVDGEDDRHAPSRSGASTTGSRPGTTSVCTWTTAGAARATARVKARAEGPTSVSRNA